MSRSTIIRRENEDPYAPYRLKEPTTTDLLSCGIGRDGKTQSAGILKAAKMITTARSAQYKQGDRRINKRKRDDEDEPEVSAKRRKELDLEERNRQMAKSMLGTWERVSVNIEEESGLPASLYMEDQLLASSLFWCTHESRERRLLAILDRLVEYFQSDEYNHKELLKDDRLFERMSRFIIHQLDASTSQAAGTWTWEQLRVFARDLLLLIKWEFQPKITDEEQKALGKRIKLFCVKLKKERKLVEDKRKPIKLAVTDIRKIVVQNLKRKYAARDNLFYLLSCAYQVRPGYLLPTMTYEDKLTWGEVKLYCIQKFGKGEDETCHGFHCVVQPERSRGPSGCNCIDPKWTAGSVADAKDICLDVSLYLVALGHVQGVFKNLPTLESIWNSNAIFLPIPINDEAKAKPVFRDESGADQALRYYKAMRGLQRKAKAAGVINDSQKAVMYDTHKAESYSGIRFDNSHHDDGWGEKFLDEWDEQVEGVTGDEAENSDEAETDSDDLDDEGLDLIQAKKAHLKRLVKQLKA